MDEEGDAKASKARRSISIFCMEVADNGEESSDSDFSLPRLWDETCSLQI